MEYVPDAWIDDSKTKVGYKISFNLVLYKPQELRSLAEVCADIKALAEETEGLLDDVLFKSVSTA